MNRWFYSIMCCKKKIKGLVSITLAPQYVEPRHKNIATMRVYIRGKKDVSLRLYHSKLYHTPVTQYLITPNKDVDVLPFESKMKPVRVEIRQHNRVYRSLIKND